MRRLRWLIGGGLLLLSALGLAHHGRHADGDGYAGGTLGDGLANSTVMIIRHAEKPAKGDDLTPAGEARAQAYVEYFKHLQLNGQPLRPQVLIATAASAHSDRPQLTIQPLAQALGLPIDGRFADRQETELVAALHRGTAAGQRILICWHHGQIAALIDALGGDGASLLPHHHWPAKVYGWLVVLHFDAYGRLDRRRSLVIAEHLMPDDASKHG